MSIREGVVDPELARQMTQAPQSRVDVLVTASGGLDALLKCLPSDVTVVQAYKLTPTVSLNAPAASVWLLAELAAVKSIEPIRSVGHW